MEFNSIQDFRNNFSKIYHGKVKNYLGGFEKEKSNLKFLINFLWIIAIGLGVAIIYFVSSGFKMVPEDSSIFVLVVVPVFICVIIANWLAKKFERKIKEKVMPELMQAFGNFMWTKSSVIDIYSIREARLYNRFEWKEDDDSFFGSYKGVDININECKLKYEVRDSKGNRHEKTEFEGVLVQLRIPRNFKAHTIIRKRVALLNRKDYEEIKLEDPEFMKKYFVDGSDQVESRYLLTTSFMERFKNLQRAFGAKGLEASFKGNDLMIAIATSKDLFKLGKLNRPLADTKQFTMLLEEFISILLIVDELKLNQNIGL